MSAKGSLMSAESRSKEGMAQQSARRGRKNQMFSSCLEHAFMIWFRSANSHTGPQLHRFIRGPTYGRIRQGANPPKKPLALGGASTDEYTAYPERVRRYCPFERRGQGGDISPGSRRAYGDRSGRHDDTIEG